jgi:hypothetical protein
MRLRAYSFLSKYKVFRYALFLLLAGCANGIGSQPPLKDNSEQQSTIQEIIYRSYGGEMGYSMALHITKDSLRYFYSLAANNKSLQIDTINTSTFWDSLTVNFDIANFKKIRNGYSNQPVDGTDEEITIITNTLDTISVINADQDTLHYKSLFAFEQLIRKKTNTLN